MDTDEPTRVLNELTPTLLREAPSSRASRCIGAHSKTYLELTRAEEP